MTDVVALAAELLAIQSTTGAESDVVDFVSRWLLTRGWNVELQEVSKGRANVWARRSGNGVTLSTHLDTVPPYVAPREDDGRLYGRGACDAKGIAAAMLAAAERLAKAGDQQVSRQRGTHGEQARQRRQGIATCDSALSRTRGALRVSGAR